jgi:D-glycerate 3-kinase
MDNKAEHHCIHFLIGRLALHNAKHAFNPNPPPFFLGLNGIQGSGKTYLVDNRPFYLFLIRGKEKGILRK